MMLNFPNYRHEMESHRGAYSSSKQEEGHLQMMGLEELQSV